MHTDYITLQRAPLTPPNRAQNLVRKLEFQRGGLTPKLALLWPLHHFSPPRPPLCMHRARCCASRVCRVRYRITLTEKWLVKPSCPGFVSET